MTSLADISRRSLLAGIPLLLAGCGVGPGGFFDGGNYGWFGDNGVLVPALDLTGIDRGLLRTQVAWTGKEKPGSVVVNIPERHLFLVLVGNRALR